MLRRAEHADSKVLVVLYFHSLPYHCIPCLHPLEPSSLELVRDHKAWPGPLLRPSASIPHERYQSPAPRTGTAGVPLSWRSDMIFPAVFLVQLMSRLLDEPAVAALLVVHAPLWRLLRVSFVSVAGLPFAAADAHTVVALEAGVAEPDFVVAHLASLVMAGDARRTALGTL